MKEVSKFHYNIKKLTPHMPKKKCFGGQRVNLKNIYICELMKYNNE